MQEAVAEVTKLDGYEPSGSCAPARWPRSTTVTGSFAISQPDPQVVTFPRHRAGYKRHHRGERFRFRVPYGTLLCVSDKPLHGELKLPGMAIDFYRTQVASHLLIGVRAMEKLRDMPLERIHSRKLRSFAETAFL